MRSLVRTSSFTARLHPKIAGDQFSSMPRESIRASAGRQCCIPMSDRWPHAEQDLHMAFHDGL